MVYDKTDAETIVQDAITKSLEQISLDRPSNFRNWLFSIAINKARHHIRDRKISDRHRRGNFGRPTVSKRDAFAEIITEEALRLFDHGLARLTTLQRRILLLRIIDRLSFDRISVIVHKKPGACRALVHRARTTLQEWLEYMKAI